MTDFVKILLEEFLMRDIWIGQTHPSPGVEFTSGFEFKAFFSWLQATVGLTLGGGAKFVKQQKQNKDNPRIQLIYNGFQVFRWSIDRWNLDSDILNLKLNISKLLSWWYRLNLGFGIKLAIKTPKLKHFSNNWILANLLKRHHSYSSEV